MGCSSGKFSRRETEQRPEVFTSGATPKANCNNTAVNAGNGGSHVVSDDLEHTDYKKTLLLSKQKRSKKDRESQVRLLLAVYPLWSNGRWWACFFCVLCIVRVFKTGAAAAATTWSEL